MTRRRYLGLSALSAAAVGGYLAGPGLWQWEHAQARIKRREIIQIDVEPGPVDATLVARLGSTTTSTQSAPLIITYHDIGHNTSPYTVTPENFATQMRLLHDAGWTTLTTAQLEAWHRGEPLPPRSVLITFDDGCTGVWQYAEPVLRRYNMHAAAFIITGFVGTHAPYYMTWDHITDLHAGGRWDILAHTHLGHVHVPADAHGGTGPYLTTPMYLADQRRVETATEFHGRVTNDLTECKRQLGLRGFSDPRFFAYPFSAHEADVVQQTVLSLYAGGGMLDDSDSIQVTLAGDVARGLIRRMDIVGAMSLEGFVGRFEQAAPLDPSGIRPLLDLSGWTDRNQKPAAAISPNGAGGAVIDPGPGGQISLHYQRIRTAAWNTYTVSADLGLALAADDTSTGMVAFMGGSQYQVLVSISRGYYSIVVGDDVPFAEGELPNAPSYHVDIAACPEAVSVWVDGLPFVVPLPESRPREVASGIGLICRRGGSESSPPATINNLVIGA
jgi:peptidoglycan/xylan/chitin deacetylase (PgdA/CDA1 family)